MVIVSILLMTTPTLSTTAPVTTDNNIALTNNHQQSFVLNSAILALPALTSSPLGEAEGLRRGRMRHWRGRPASRSRFGKAGTFRNRTANFFVDATCEKCRNGFVSFSMKVRQKLHFEEIFLIPLGN